MATAYVSGNPPFTTPPPEPWQASECYGLDGPNRLYWSPLCVNERINGTYENVADFWYDAQPVNGFTRKFDPSYGSETLSVSNRIQLYNDSLNRLETIEEKDKITSSVGNGPLYVEMTNQTNSSISAYNFDGKYFQYQPTIQKPQFSLVVELDPLPSSVVTQSILHSIDSSVTTHHLYYEFDPSGAKSLKYDVTHGATNANCTINIRNR